MQADVYIRKFFLRIGGKIKRERKEAQLRSGNLLPNSAHYFAAGHTISICLLTLFSLQPLPSIVRNIKTAAITGVLCRPRPGRRQGSRGCRRSPPAPSRSGEPRGTLAACRLLDPSADGSSCSGVGGLAERKRAGWCEEATTSAQTEGEELFCSPPVLMARGAQRSICFVYEEDNRGLLVSSPNPNPSMPLAATQEGEASGSRSRAGRRRRRLESRPNPPALRRGSTPTAMPTTRTSQSTSERSQRRKKRRAAAAAKNKRSKKGKRRIREEEERNLGREEVVVVSSSPSSPLCEPYLPGDGVIYNRIRHRKIYEAFDSARAKFQQKLAREMKLPTLEYFRASTCLSDDRRLLPVGESGTEAVLCAAKFVLRPSSSVGDKPLRRRCSGFWIEWDEKNKTGVVLTTAHLIRSNCPSMDHWLGKDEYAPDAKHDDEGPVIDFDANVVRIINNSTGGSFIPSSILLKCLDLWRNHGYIFPQFYRSA